MPVTARSLPQVEREEPLFRLYSAHVHTRQAVPGNPVSPQTVN